MRTRLAVTAFALIVLLVPSVSATAAIEISTIRYDPPGDDDGSNQSLVRETVRLVNTGTTAVRLRGWTLHSEAHLVFSFPRLRLEAGQTVTVHTGTGDDTKRHLYWNLTIYAWANDGDAATLYDRRMRVADTCSYAGGGTSATC
jgi:P pilus assembly chaperone PapD